MLLPAQPSTLPLAPGVRHKRSRSDAFGGEDTRTRCDFVTVRCIEHNPNNICGILDIRAEKNKPEGVLDNVFADNNILRDDIATDHRAANGENNLTDDGLTDDDLIDEGIGDDDSTCSTETIEPGDIKVETLWNRTYLIDQW